MQAGKEICRASSPQQNHFAAGGEGSELRLEVTDTFPRGDVEHPEGPKAFCVPMQGQCLRVLSSEVWFLFFVFF